MPELPRLRSPELARCSPQLQLGTSLLLCISPLLRGSCLVGVENWDLFPPPSKWPVANCRPVGVGGSSRLSAALPPAQGQRGWERGCAAGRGAAPLAAPVRGVGTAAAAARVRTVRGELGGGSSSLLERGIIVGRSA